MIQSHTPTPWKTGDSKKDGMAYTKKIEFAGMGRTAIGFVEAPSGSQIMINQADANAEFIVRACNAHDELVNACETVLSNLKPVYTGDHIVIKKLTAALAKAKAV